MAKKQPIETAEEPANLTDTNGAPEAMDEDGEALNEEASEIDNTPAIHKLAVHCYHPKGSAELHTELNAMIHVATGYQAKRLVLTGTKTARQIADQLLNVANW